jgi:uncharacterized protein (TIGR00297 family)
VRFAGLTPGGALAALLVGGVTLAIAGWQGALVLFAFFIPSTLLSRIGKARKRELTDIGKTGPRDAWQVVANGGVAALALLFAPHYGALAFAAFAGAFAAASADTWGTEIGTLARGKPRSILTFQEIPTGLSGGITVQGTLAECAGAGVVAFVAALVHVGAFLPVFAAGVAGAVVDSALGATAQALRYCPACERRCETNPHSCGRPTVVIRGLNFLENDAVNFAATLTGALCAFAIMTFAPR